MLIIRRLKCIDAVSGIVTLSQWPSGAPDGQQNIKTRSICLRMRNVSDKSCRGNQNTRFVFYDFFFPPEIMPFMRCGKKL